MYKMCQNFIRIIFCPCTEDRLIFFFSGQRYKYNIFGINQLIGCVGRKYGNPFFGSDHHKDTLGVLTVGVVGTGRIGAAVIRLLSSFGCRVLAYNRTQSQEISAYAEYVDLDTLYGSADMITLHVPLTEKTHHMINRESLRKMKDGVVIINCARGELAENDALIEGIESGKIGALGLDVVEDETGITHVDHRIDILSNQKMAYLRQFRNVVMTPHMAFYTDTAVRNMVRCGVQGILYMAEGN